MISLTSAWKPAVDNGKDKNNSQEIGYKKPPRHSQFKPGQSGNPNGRPKAGPKFADAVAKQLRKKVKVSMGNEVHNVTMLQAIAMKHVSLAAIGNPKSTAIVLNCLQRFENNSGNELPALLEQFRALHASHAEKDSVPRPPAESTPPKSDDASRIEGASVFSGLVEPHPKEGKEIDF